MIKYVLYKSPFLFQVRDYVYKSFRHTYGKGNPFFFLLFMHRVKNIGSISVTSVWSDLLFYVAICSKGEGVSSKCSVSHRNGVGFPNLADS